MADQQEPNEQPEPAAAQTDEPAGELAEERLDQLAGGKTGIFKSGEPDTDRDNVGIGNSGS